MNNNPELPERGVTDAQIDVLPGAVTGYATGLLLAMRFVASERPAYRQQKIIHQQHPHLLQVHSQTVGE